MSHYCVRSLGPALLSITVLWDGMAHVADTNRRVLILPKSSEEFLGSVAKRRKAG